MNVYMGGMTPKVDYKPENQYAVGFYYNRNFMVFAENNNKRYSFYPIDTIYNKPTYNITKFDRQKAKEVISSFLEKKFNLNDYEPEFEIVNTRKLIQDGYLNEDPI